MVRQVQFLNNICVVLLLLFSNCTSEEQKIENNIALNEDSIYIKTTLGITYVNGNPYSGKLYVFFPNILDTFEVKEFLNGKETGVWKQFYTHHQLKQIRYFDNGKKTGEYYSWWENKKKKASYFFVNDEYEGPFREWSAEGNLIKELNYHAGHEEGTQKAWYLNGKIKSNYTIIKGRRYGLLGTKNCENVSDSIFKK